jgi:glucose/arabinose dehydrogenase
MKFIIVILIIILNLQLSNAQQIDLVPFATGFSNPVAIENAGDTRLFVVEQEGFIHIVDQSGTVNPVPFLDITSIVNDGQNEQGLLGLAFHPNYLTNGYFYLNYTVAGGNTQISRFTVNGGNPDLGDATSELQILNIGQPYGNHNGGDLNFGPDGYLYIGMGDGGSAGDPGDRAQDPQELLGKMLRIDVDSGSPYTIPASNPFVSDGSTLDEIWALGMRNPWRFTFDSQTGDMWIADVGQNAWEEIDMQPGTSTGGENYGWRCYEASASYDFTGNCPVVSSLTFPVYEFSQSGSPGGCSVTGGMVYRGSNYPALDGHYVFSDFCGDWIMTIYDNGGSWATINHGTWANSGFSTFGEDMNGELYVAALFTGVIYQLSDLIDLEELESNAVTSIYPNPTEGVITISFDYREGQNYTLEIHSITGQLVKQTSSISSSEIQLDLSSLNGGIYTFRIYSNSIPVGKGKLTVK